VFCRLLTNTTNSAAAQKTLASIVKSLIKEETRQFALKNCDNLSLVLSLRRIYLGKFAEAQKTKQLEFELFGDKAEAHVQQLKQIVSKATSSYPRMHSAIKLIVNEITSLNEPKDRARVVGLVMKDIFDNHFFNEEYYFSLKSTYRPKFLHIGLKFWETLINDVIGSETS
jgi:hypothetical protein